MGKTKEKRKESLLLFGDDDDAQLLVKGSGSKPAKKASNSLLDEGDGSAAGDGLELKVNQEYAKRFEVSSSLVAHMHPLPVTLRLHPTG